MSSPAPRRLQGAPTTEATAGQTRLPRALWVLRSSNVVLRDIRIEGTLGFGAVVTASLSVRMERVTVKGCGFGPLFEVTR